MSYSSHLLSVSYVEELVRTYTEQNTALGYLNNIPYMVRDECIVLVMWLVPSPRTLHQMMIQGFVTCLRYCFCSSQVGQDPARTTQSTSWSIRNTLASPTTILQTRSELLVLLLLPRTTCCSSYNCKAVEFHCVCDILKPPAAMGRLANTRTRHSQGDIKIAEGSECRWLS